METKNKSTMDRRRFLHFAGVGGSAAVVLAACSKDHNSGDNAPDGSIDLGRDDMGILNYAYALEQLEAAFYSQVVSTPYAGITDKERGLLTDIRDHEVAHRMFFQKALAGMAIPALEVNFETVDFNNRDSVLNTAKTFEDLGVSAYNGAGKLIKDPVYLLLAGKIVSVEARHAALIRDLISNGTFADSSVVDSNGLDLSNEPAIVLAAAAPFLRSTIWGGNLPTE